MSEAVLRKKTVANLRSLLSTAQLSTTGRKAELIARLREHQQLQYRIIDLYTFIALNFAVLYIVVICILEHCYSQYLHIQHGNETLFNLFYCRCSTPSKKSTPTPTKR